MAPQPSNPNDVRLLTLPQHIFEYLYFVFTQHLKGGVETGELSHAAELQKRFQQAPLIDFTKLGKAEVVSLDPNKIQLNLNAEQPQAQGGTGGISPNPADQIQPAPSYACLECFEEYGNYACVRPAHQKQKDFRDLSQVLINDEARCTHETQTHGGIVRCESPAVTRHPHHNSHGPVNLCLTHEREHQIHCKSVHCNPTSRTI